MTFQPQIFRNAYEVLRSPDRQPKCYDMTEQERNDAIMLLNSKASKDIQIGLNNEQSN